MDKKEQRQMWSRLRANMGALDKLWDTSVFMPVREIKYLDQRLIEKVESLRPLDYKGTLWYYSTQFDDNLRYNGPSWQEMADGIKNGLFRIEEGLVFGGYWRRDGQETLEPKGILHAPNLAWPTFTRIRHWSRLSDDPEIMADIAEVDKYIQNLDV
jgi:hypothetical protein